VADFFGPPCVSTADVTRLLTRPMGNLEQVAFVVTLSLSFNCVRMFFQRLFQEFGLPVVNELSRVVK